MTRSASLQQGLFPSSSSKSLVPPVVAKQMTVSSPRQSLSLRSSASEARLFPQPCLIPAVVAHVTPPLAGKASGPVLLTCGGQGSPRVQALHGHTRASDPPPPA